MAASTGQGGVSMSVVYAMYDALVSINVPDEKARAVIDAMEREMMGKLATKVDMENLRAATKADIAAVRHEMSSEFAAVRQEMSAEFKLVRQEMAAMGASLSKDMQIQMGALQNTLTIRLGFMMAAMIAAATGLLTLGQYLR